MYFFYRILTAVGMLLLAPYYALRGWRRGEPASALGERLGSVPPVIVARAAASARRMDLPPARSGFTPCRWVKCWPPSRSPKD